MSIGELLLTTIVALFVFGPHKLPLLMQHAGRMIRRLNHYKEQATLFLDDILREQQRQDNEEKAKKAEQQHLGAGLE